MRVIHFTGAIALLSIHLSSVSAHASLKDKCGQGKKTTRAAPSIPGLRSGAQRGLDYLVRASKAWTAKHKCYGCHVQAVTLEGLTVGKRNQYQVKTEDIQAMVSALKLNITAGGHRTGAAFQGAAWAGYDQWIDEENTPHLLKYAALLQGYQRPNGSVEDDDRRPPVVAGTMQTTFQAMQTWRQAYARTADNKWLGPIRKAEGYLMGAARRWKTTAQISILDLNYALLGMVAAGVKSAEPTSLKLQKALLARQNKDGGFGLTAKSSDALATGQTLYALKRAGYSDREPAIARGMRYLISHQAKDGSWRTVKSRQNGADKGEAMWAVLGLVSVDVISVAFEGIRDGQRVDRALPIDVRAEDNGAGNVRKIELLVDDLKVHRSCGAKAHYTIDPSKLPQGRHFLDVVATNDQGRSSTRRIDFYTGDIYMTHVGTRFVEGAQTTEISLRNIAPSASQAGKIRVDIYTEGKKARRVYRKDYPGKVGAMTLFWAGKSRGRYVARVQFVNKSGSVLQREDRVFFHDSARVQQQKYGEIEGRLSTKKGNAGFAADAVVELVDKKGKVVQSTRSTEQGNYRFKNVDKGDYKIRVRKRGFQSKEAPVRAAPAAAPAKVDVNLR